MRTLRTAAHGLLSGSLVMLGACAGDATAPISAPTTAAFSLGLPGGSSIDTIAIGATVQLKASLANGGNSSLVTRWATSAPTVVKLTSSGLVTGLALGSAVVGAYNGYAVDTVRIVVANKSATTPVTAPVTTPVPTPTPAPTPTPTPTATGGAAKVFALMGTVPSVGAVEGLGGAFAKYEQDFRTVGDQRSAADGVYYDPADYYDRAMIDYVWWARTGNQTYLDRANALAINYRQNYLVANNYPFQTWWMMLDGIALHYLVTGDQASLTAIGRMADRVATNTSIADVGNVRNADNRDQARVLMALVLANYVKAPSATGSNWATLARKALTNILATQSADGAYRITAPGANQCGYNKPFMVGVLNDAMIRYYTLLEPDSRIPTAVKKAVDYMWAKDWNASGQGFVYIEGSCNGDGPTIASDLNNLAVSGFGFVYKRTGDVTYRTRGDQVFAGGVYKGYIGGAKQFNQEYTNSFRYLGLRQ